MDFDTFDEITMYEDDPKCDNDYDWGDYEWENYRG